jgi:hypothetical protein
VHGLKPQVAMVAVVVGRDLGGPLPDLGLALGAVADAGMGAVEDVGEERLDVGGVLDEGWSAACAGRARVPP